MYRLFWLAIAIDSDGIWLHVKSAKYKFIKTSRERSVWLGIWWLIGNKQYSVINGSGHTRKKPQHVNRTTIVRTHSICSSDRAAHGTYSTSYEYSNRILYLCAWDVLRSPGSHCFTSPICLSFRMTATQNQIDLNRIGIDRRSTAQIRNCRFRSIVSMICLCCCAANKFLRLDAHLICVL